MLPSKLLLLSLLFLAVYPLPLQDSLRNNEDITDPCFLFLKDLGNSSIAAIDRSLEANNTLLHSGHNINDLGTYKMCNDKATQAYSIMAVTYGGGLSGITGNIGLCVPWYCSTEKLQTNADKIVKILSNLIKKDVSNIASVSFIDPTNLGINKGFWFYFSIVLLAGLGILITIGTISANTKIKVKSKKVRKVQPDSLIESGVRDALLLNKDSTNETISKFTLNNYLAGGPGSAGNTSSEEKPLGEELVIKGPKPLFIRIAECFDLRRNISDLFKNEMGAGHDPNLNVVHGIRAFAFGWVVYGHTFMLVQNVKNIAYLMKYMKSFWFLVLMAALYAVDTFFFLGGFFTSFFMVNKLRKMKLGLKNYGKLFLHRWLRLWPAYFVAILIFWKVGVYFGNGVLWYTYVNTAQACENQAWKNWLFLDNALSYNDNCFLWGWYLSNDFQMFLFAPFICWIYIRNRQRSFNVIWILMLMSVMASYTYASNSGVFYFLELFTGGGGDQGDFSINYYMNPIVRMAPYLLGLYLGFIFKEYKAGKKNFFSWLKASATRSAVCALLGFGVLVFVTFYPRALQIGEDQWKSGFAMTWSISGRSLFAIGIFMIIAPGLVGNLKAFSAFMSNYYFAVISKVSYSAYLVHLIILQIWFSNSDQLPGLSQGYESIVAFSVAVLSIFAAMILHLVIEKPIVNIETRILNKKIS